MSMLAVKGKPRASQGMFSMRSWAAGGACASLLVVGVVELLHKSTGDGTALPKLRSGHPLFKTLCAHPSAPAQLLACLAALLLQPEEAAKLRRHWLQWQPFISLALLDHGEGETISCLCVSS